MALSGLLDALTWGRVLGYGALLIVASFLFDFATAPRYPEQIHQFGYGHGLWASVRNGIGFFSCHQSWISEGYAKYGRKGLPFAIPSSMYGSDVVLPQSLVTWLMDQPESTLSTLKAHNVLLFARYNFLGGRLADDDLGTRAVHKFLPRNLPGFIPDMDDEVKHAVDMTLGHVTEEWTSVKLWDMWLNIVPRVINRMLAGSGACRDETFLKAMVSFTHDVIRNSTLLGMLPGALHPVFGRLMAIPNWLHWWSAYKRVRPVITKRLDDMTRKAEGDAQYNDWAPPEDCFTWVIRLAMGENSPQELDPAVISMRLLPLEFASIHTTLLTGHSWMLDLLSTPPQDAILDVLRDEVRAHKPPSGVWTKAGLLALVRADSSIRESQRLSNFHTTLVRRMVVAPHGVRLPGFDWTLPRGVNLTVNLHGTHHDEALFHNAHAYDPLRYARIREAWEHKPEEERSNARDQGRVAMGLGMVTTSDHHFAFGHGRHACPGRFFVAHELKLIMAHLLLNYDVKMLGARPQSQWIGSTAIPPFKACVEIRRKRAASPSRERVPE
ncbi:Ent-kaurene oxidase [Tolypocladium ophioglossoides CBS 100239]|uniref:Ent-kaurene oxidase n=1 Tax=Tolypocladium ophioglossoides (strain CBS 100239) TaxID=1163406 RepID=A0A0L0N4A8_TOLOC|nr:Ent-kaurene oxidase [Tolypocladium ophioglossoides CBS 100239]